MHITENISLVNVVSTFMTQIGNEGFDVMKSYTTISDDNLTFKYDFSNENYSLHFVVTETTIQIYYHDGIEGSVSEYKFDGRALPNDFLKDLSYIKSNLNAN